MKKKVAISLVIMFVFGFLLGHQVNLDFSKKDISPLIEKKSSIEKNKIDSLQVQKTDIQCFVEALIISIYPNTALRLNNCKSAHVDVVENGFKKLAVKDNGKDVLKALKDYSRSDVELDDFIFFINMLMYQLSLENHTIGGGSKNWILFPQNLLIPYESTYPEALYYLAQGYYLHKDCKIALELYEEYRKLGGNVEIEFEGACKD